MTHNITRFHPAQYRHTPVKKIKFYDTQVCRFGIRTGTHLIAERKKFSFSLPLRSNQY